MPPSQRGVILSEPEVIEVCGFLELFPAEEVLVVTVVLVEFCCHAKGIVFRDLGG